MGISFFSLLLVSFTAVTTANLIEDVANGLKNAVDCDSCHLLLIPLQGLAHLGDQIFVDSVDTVCKTFKVSWSYEMLTYILTLHLAARGPRCMRR